MRDRSVTLIPHFPRSSNRSAVACQRAIRSTIRLGAAGSTACYRAPAASPRSPRATPAAVISSNVARHAFPGDPLPHVGHARFPSRSKSVATMMPVRFAEWRLDAIRRAAWRPRRAALAGWRRACWCSCRDPRTLGGKSIRWPTTGVAFATILNCSAYFLTAAILLGDSRTTRFGVGS
jgi:hypothetical protein